MWNISNPKALESQMQAALSASHGGFSPSRSDLLNQVVGVGGDADGYFLGGFICALGLRATLALFDKQIEEFQRVLDFGCGSARIVHWLVDSEYGNRLFACDINEPAIQWSKENVPGVKFETTGSHPPLPYPDQHFDLVYGISVLTHLDEDLQNLWLRELQRIVKPDGFLLLTVHGDDKAYNDLPETEYQEFQRKGFLYKRAGVHKSVEGLPDFYQVAFHAVKYIQSHWPKDLIIRGYIPHGPMYAQDLVVLQRKGMEASSAAPAQPLVEIDLPMGFMEVPKVGAILSDKELIVSGWAFSRNQTHLDLDLWLDGERAGQCVTGQPRPDLLQVYPGFPTAGTGGFSATISLQDSRPGSHVVWITKHLETFPISTTYFFTS